MELLRNAVRPYAWGSRTAIAELQGRSAPAAHPEAELWMGAHPADSSRLAHPDGSETSLIDLLRSAPEEQLGVDCTQRWGPRLPFLFKVLAANEALSLQAHPSLEQAQEGFAKEEAAGIPLDALERNYVDPNHKPELICALTEFHAMAGFRDVARTLRLLTALDVRAIKAHIDLLAAQPGQDGLRALFTTWITLPQPALNELLPKVLDGCVEHVRSRGEFAQVCRNVLGLGEAYPGDAGVLATLLLNHIVLQPGEALYLPAGNLHAYLRGTGIEIMANSDNVLRGGLTPKHVDVPELLRVLDFTSGNMPVLTGKSSGPRAIVYPTPAPDFQLSRLDWPVGATEAVLVGESGPQILLCTSGKLDIKDENGRIVRVSRGESVWFAAADPPVVVRPAGSDAAVPTQAFLATTGKH